ncbi:MAG: glycoside hydrolase, partial [Fervidobacterium sp.]
GLALIKLILEYEDIWKIPENEWNKLVEEFYKTIDEYKNIWNKYNRSGGLEDSIFKLSRFLRVRQADLRGLIF